MVDGSSRKPRPRGAATMPDVGALLSYVLNNWHFFKLDFVSNLLMLCCKLIAFVVCTVSNNEHEQC